MKKTKETLFVLFWTLRLIIRAAPKETVLVSLFLIIQGISPCISLIAVQQIIDWLSATRNLDEFPYLLLAIWGTTLLIETASEPILAKQRLQLNEKILASCNLLIMKKANDFPDLRLYENPEMHATIQFLKDEAKRRPLNFIYILAGFLRGAIALGGILCVLGSIQWWFPLFVLLSGLPHGFSTVWFEKQSWDAALFRSPETRKMAKIASLTLEEPIAKEIRLFGFGNYLVENYHSLSITFQQSMHALRRKPAQKFFLFSLLTVFLHICSLSWLVLAASKSLLSSGMVILGLQALLYSQRETGLFMQGIGMLAQPFLFFQKLQNFLNFDCNSCSSDKIKIESFKHSIQFENVSFYFTPDKFLVDGISFIILKGERIAVIGENGAGKSTLLNLLLGFYKPSKGRILIDGIDLQQIDLTSWRSCLTGTFQEFGRYEATIAENIAFGDVRCIKELDKIENAARLAGFHKSIVPLPDGFNTLLGRETTGINLSGGQWQKLALSRAFMKEADILIFDEPTSALDPRSEMEFFQSLLEITREKTVIFISHRLDCVEISDKVFFMKNGKMEEEGAPSELVRFSQSYSSFFGLNTFSTKYDN